MNIFLNKLLKKFADEVLINENKKLKLENIELREVASAAIRYAHTKFPSDVAYDPDKIKPECEPGPVPINQLSKY